MPVMDIPEYAEGVVETSPPPDPAREFTGPTLSVTVPRRDLVRALELPSRAASAKASLPIFRSVLVRAGGNELRIQGTDLEIEAETTCSAAGSGMAAIPAALFRERVAALPEGDVTLRPSGVRLEMVCRNTRYVIPVDDHENYPSVRGVNATAWELPGRDLATALRAALPAALQDPSQPVLSACSLQFAGGEMRAAALDKHRLHVVQRKVPIPDEAALLLPARAVRLLTDGLDPECRWSVAWDGNQLLVSDGPTRITSRLLGEKYFNYRRVIPNPAAAMAEWEFNAADMVSALKRAQAVAKSAFTVDRVTLTPDGDCIRLDALNDEEHAEDRVSATITGEQIVVAYNSANVIQALDQFRLFGQERVTLYLTETLAPALLTGAGADLFRAVLYPMDPGVSARKADHQ